MALQRPSESERISAILAKLDELYPEATCELDFRTPFQLIVSTILSAQTTDKRVNLVTPALFDRFPDAKSLAEAELPELESIIRSTGFFRAKARNLKAMAQALMRDHGGKVPRQMESLVALPGVARKTANVVLGTAYGIAEGVVVDTHIGRLSRRLALSKHDDPQKVERDLMRRVPQTSWIKLGHQLIWHGRRVCFARKPNCGGCTLATLCPSAFRAESPSQRKK